MSYPDPRYLGAGGEINAVFRPADTEPELVSPAGQRTHYLATHALTEGEFGLYRVDMPPRSPGPSTHFHRTISESFYRAGRAAGGVLRADRGDGPTRRLGARSGSGARPRR